MTVPIFLRVPDDLKRAVEERATKEGVSVNEFATNSLAAAVGLSAEESESADALEKLEIALNLLTERAKNGKIITAVDFAKHTEGSWVRNRAPVKALLERIWRACEQRGYPQLVAVVAEQEDGTPVDFFFQLAQRAGVQVDDPDAFAIAQQQACFRWGAENADGGAARSLDPWPHLRGVWRGPDVDDFQDFMRGPPDETASG